MRLNNVLGQLRGLREIFYLCLPIYCKGYLKDAVGQQDERMIWARNSGSITVSEAPYIQQPERSLSFIMQDFF